MKGCTKSLIRSIKDFLNVSESAIKQYPIKKRYLMQYGLNCLKKDVTNYLKSGGSISSYFVPVSELPAHKRLTIRPRKGLDDTKFIEMLKQYAPFIEDAEAETLNPARKTPFLVATQRSFEFPSGGFSSQALFLLIEKMHKFYENVIILELTDPHISDGKSIFGHQTLFDIRRLEQSVSVSAARQDIDSVFRGEEKKVDRVTLFTIPSIQDMSEVVVGIVDHISAKYRNTLIIVIKPFSGKPLYLKDIEKIKNAKANKIGLVVFGHVDFLHSCGCSYLSDEMQNFKMVFPFNENECLPVKIRYSDKVIRGIENGGRLVDRDAKFEFLISPQDIVRLSKKIKKLKIDEKKIIAGYIR